MTNPTQSETLLREAIQQALAHRYGDWTGILEAALQSIPEPLLDEGLVELIARLQRRLDHARALSGPTELWDSEIEELIALAHAAIPRLEAGSHDALVRDLHRHAFDDGQPGRE